MATNTKIEWAHHTFNPWIGCTKVSAGCTNCYAENLMDKRYRRVEWGPNGTRVRTKQPWRDVRKWYREASETGERFRIFCASLADVAEDRDELIPWRADLCDVIRDTADRLDWLLLSKRPQNYTRLFPDDVLRLCWVGTSVEDQEQADARIPHLLKCPAVVRFLSCEPLLGALNLFGDGVMYKAMKGLADVVSKLNGDHTPSIDWVIVGGESGPGARPCNVDWIRSIIGQCRAASVPVLVKQLGAWPYDPSWHGDGTPEGSRMKPNDRKGSDMDEWPDDLKIRQTPKC